MTDTPESPSITLQDLLYQEEVLVINPPLATAIGLNESIVVQQMVYWLKRSTHIHDGQRWIYNTYAQWQNQFPFWSVDTIKRTIRKLESAGILLSTDRLNANTWDRTKWYTINYRHAIVQIGGANPQNGGGQGAPLRGGQSAPIKEGNLPRSTLDRDYIPETTAETTVGGDAAPSQSAFSKSSRKKSTPVPDAIEITEAMQGKALGYGVAAERIVGETERFLNHHRSKGSRFVDWRAAWYAWMQRAPDYAPARKETPAGDQSWRAWIDEEEETP